MASSSTIEVVTDSIAGRDVDDLGAVTREPFEEIHVRRELEIGQDDLGGAGRHNRKHDAMMPMATVTFWCIVIVPRETPRIGASRSLVFLPELPPALVPGTDAPAAPGLGVVLQVGCGAAAASPRASGSRDRCNPRQSGIPRATWPTSQRTMIRPFTFALSGSSWSWNPHVRTAMKFPVSRFWPLSRTPT